MSDHDATPEPVDPIDRAYAEAEAALSDEAARAARRARVLGAVAQDQPAAADAPASSPASSAPPPLPVVPRRAWERGGWLVAAGLAGVALLIAFRTYAPLQILPRPATPPAAQSASQPASEAAAAGGPAAADRSDVPAARPAASPARPSAGASALSRPSAGPPAAPTALPPPPPQAFPGAPAPAAPPAPAPPPSAAMRAAPPAAADDVSEVAVTGQRRQDKLSAESAAPPVTAGNRSAADTGLDPAARLRAAAAAGRTAEVKVLLAQGAPVDAPDASGDTALMKAVQGDHPATAALLRRHGASLDRRNRAGESARDMADRVGDPRLDEALGLER